ncbi:hypothetical protein RT761_00056 [Atribacter laminatus]|uniref:Transposase IS204/IS1001/IS1096/IS1165 zinc-finger domain-containing protein n=1 Tax=Atribacter laminatus TaxID=2847778 RepID=A0A7T1F1L2_ATRLM|nr:hypothetical protein RT761_00056 [Atribacter laminatus]
MSQIQLNPFFDFCRVKVINQTFYQEKRLVTVTIHSDNRYDPVCRCCQNKMKEVHSYHERKLRDLNFPSSKISFFLSTLKKKFSRLFLQSGSFLLYFFSNLLFL